MTLILKENLKDKKLNLRRIEAKIKSLQKFKGGVEQVLLDAKGQIVKEIYELDFLIKQANK